MNTDLSQHQQQLLAKQYADASNLNARVALHRRFSTNKTDWQVWVFDQFEFPANAHILELGGGPGWLWRNNFDRIPPGWRITLTDFSAGMVDEARTSLAGESFAFRQCDAQDLPFKAGTYDAVIANHMLYHVPDIAQAIREIHRVLKSRGLFYTTTVGPRHLHELHALWDRFAPGAYEKNRQKFIGTAFNLETGAQTIETMFPQVERRLFEDAFVITEVEPLVAYILSFAPDEFKSADLIARLRAHLHEEMAATKAIKITKESGMFIARKP
jgi:ubiquinone/menaquinone biosynthesis C-methylase UbiE